MQTLEHQNIEWYTKLVGSLSNQDKKSLQDVYTLADQRKNARESRNIEQAGGKCTNDERHYLRLAPRPHYL